MDISNKEFIKMAASVIKPKKIKDVLIGDVGCALLAGNGKIYFGVCTGVCAEQNALGAMVTDGEYSIKKIVATWKDDNGDIYVIPPCGKCREAICYINPENLDNTDVVLDQNEVVKLRDLYPGFWLENFKKQTLA